MVKKKLTPYKKENLKKVAAITAASILGTAALGTGSYYLYKKTKKKQSQVQPDPAIVQMEDISSIAPVYAVKPKLIEYPSISDEDFKFLEQFEYALKKLKISHVNDYKKTYESFCVYYKKYKDFLDLHCKYSGNDKQKDTCIRRNLRDRYKIENIHRKAKELASRKCQ